jgi:hypothetical protein
MNCPFCDHSNADERNYCGSCGHVLVRYCSSCGFRNLTLDRFCGGCGLSLIEARGNAPVVLRAPPEKPSPMESIPPSTLTELLDAAREADGLPADDSDDRVSQDDIDSLFGD